MAEASRAEEEQAALFGALAALIERCGVEPFVAAPLLEADDRFFPDEWHANDASVAKLARRLLDYAGLGSYEVAVELAADTHDASSAPVWLAGLDGTTCRFGTALTRLDDALLVVATVAHAVARVFRVVHGFDDDPADLARAASVTSIYLGFGILTTNASYRYRAKGELRGGVAVTEWSHERFGGLSPDAMSFLLAVQLAARDATSAQVRAVAHQLEPNQRTYFEDAYRDLMPKEVAARLRLPDRAQWPAERPLPPKPAGTLVRSLLAAARELSRTEDASLPAAALVKGRSDRENVGRSTFRVIGTAAATWTAIGVGGSLIGFLVAAAIASRVVSGPPLAWVPGWLVAAWFLSWPVIGFAVGKRRRRDRCSDPSCNAILPPSAATCPDCGGTIAATLRNRNERLDVEERMGLNRADHVAPGAEPAAGRAADEST